jgi:fumarate hydratase class II
VLTDAFQQFRARFQAKPDAAVKYLSEGESPRDGKVNPVDLAAYTTVASLILNMDEAITKE